MQSAAEPGNAALDPVEPHGVPSRRRLTAEPAQGRQPLPLGQRVLWSAPCTAGRLLQSGTNEWQQCPLLGLRAGAVVQQEWCISGCEEPWDDYLGPVGHDSIVAQPQQLGGCRADFRHSIHREGDQPA